MNLHFIALVNLTLNTTKQRKLYDYELKQLYMLQKYTKVHRFNSFIKLLNEAVIDKTDSGQLHNSLIKCVFDQWCKVIAVTILQIIFPIILAWLAWHTRSVQLEIASDRVSQQFYILKPNLSKVRPLH